MRDFIKIINEAISAYHGSSNTDPVFSATHTGNNSHTFGSYHSTRHGTFFSNNKNFSAMYGHVGEYEVDIENTLDLENDNNTIYNFVNSLDAFDPEQRNVWQEARGIMRSDSHWELFENEVGDAFVAYLKNLGYDSAMFTEFSEDDRGTEQESRTTVVFDPSRIKRLR